MICSFIFKKSNLKGCVERVKKALIYSTNKHDSTHYSKRRDETVKNQ